jgi:hypothetical protein
LRNALKTLVSAFLSCVAFTCADALPTHYLVVSESNEGTLSVVSHQIVDIDGDLDSLSVNPHADGFTHVLSAQVLPKNGKSLQFKSSATTSAFIRGEFHGAPHESGVGYNITNHIVPATERVYVVRVPATAGGTLRLQKDAGSLASVGVASAASVLELDLDDLMRSPSVAALPSGYDAGTLIDNGPSSNRLDILLMGDGYTASQKAKFIADATSLANNFLNITPYRDFAQLINVHWLFVPSNQSGADKPTCAETPGSAVVAVDTAFDGTFCVGGIRRLVTVNYSKTNTAAAAVPGWDQILMLVNDNEYGGSGGPLSVVSTNSAAVGIAQHEFGHTFTLLADEYGGTTPNTSCSDLVGAALLPCRANVTNETDRTRIKWRQWIKPTTPTPTIGAISGDPLTAGLWEGAYYTNTGTYRQCFNGMMRSLGTQFCDVDREAFVKRLYAPTQGSWGVPASGVRLIDPDAEPPGTAVVAIANTTLEFRARVVGSLTPLAVEWRVDGALVSSANVTHGSLVTYVFPAPSSGTFTVELRVTDATSFLLAPQTSSRTWSVIVGTHALNVHRVGSGSGTITSSPPLINCGTRCAQGTPSPTNVTLTATADAGSKLVGWLGDCASNSATCSLRVNGAVNVRAVFAPSSTVGSLDLDSNGQLDALTDGLLAMRYFQKLTARALTASAVGPRAARTGSASITQHADNISPLLDVDGNGLLEAANDGVLIVRYLLGFRGDPLIANAIGRRAGRNTAAAVETHLQPLMVPN